MTRQSNFTIIAPIVPEKLADLKDLLEKMTVCPGQPGAQPGTADPCNPIVPFALFKQLHYARFVILDDPTLGDFDRVCEPVPDYPLSLAFMGDCDGRADDFLIDLAQRARGGLREVFSHCECFKQTTDLLSWMQEHSVPAAAAYVNHIGRTVAQIRDEEKVRAELLRHLKAGPPAGGTSAAIHAELVAYAIAQKLIPPRPKHTPLWRKLLRKTRELLRAASVPAAVTLAGSVVAVVLIAILASIAIVLLTAVWNPFPFFVAASARVLLAAVLIFLIALRVYEIAEAEIVIRPTDAQARELASLEDYDAVNQYSVIGSVKRSAFRSGMLKLNLRIVAWLARRVYKIGFLARIRTIHFARWVFINESRRILFASSYDGSLESYNDDFINKGGFGLNFAFASGFGYPRCLFLLFDGATNEQKFKYALRRHQIPTQVWYNAYPGLTVYDLARNARVRAGLDRDTMSSDEARAWLFDL